MDAQVKGYLEAWGARLLHLAATNPQAYIETRLETDKWWREWQEDHYAQVGAHENQVSLIATQEARAMLADFAQQYADRLDELLPPGFPAYCRQLAPDARTLRDWVRAMEAMGDDAIMDLLTHLGE